MHGANNGGQKYLFFSQSVLLNPLICIAKSVLGLQQLLMGEAPGPTTLSTYTVGSKIKTYRNGSGHALETANTYDCATQ